MKHFIAIAALVALAFATHDRVIERADIVTVGQETIDIGDHVVAVLDGETHVAYELRRTGATIEQRSGRAMYRVHDGALEVRSAGGAIGVEGNAVIVVDGARYAVAEGAVDARALREDRSLLRWIEEARGVDLVERLGELQRMRAALSDESAAGGETPLADDADDPIEPDESDDPMSWPEGNGG